MKKMDLNDKQMLMFQEMVTTKFPQIISMDTNGSIIPETNATPIEWYEFMMTYLVEAIININPINPDRSLKKNFLDFYWHMNMYWSFQTTLHNYKYTHPVEYLHVIFKKIIRWRSIYYWG